MTESNDDRDAIEIISLRARLHDVSNQLHVATVRVEVTASKLENVSSQLDRMSVQLGHIEDAVHDLRRDKANLDGRMAIISLLISGVMALGMWALTKWMP